MNYTNIEQSKKLLELGLNPESADMIFLSETDEHWDAVIAIPYKDYKEKEKCIPCWSVGALLEVMPPTIVANYYKDHTNLFQMSLTPAPERNKFSITYDTSMREICLISKNGESSLEAAYYMTVWLLENNYIKKE